MGRLLSTGCAACACFRSLLLPAPAKKELQQRVVFQQHAALIGGPNATSCPVCHKLFLGGEALMEHMKHTHKDPNASGVASKYLRIIEHPRSPSVSFFLSPFLLLFTRVRWGPCRMPIYRIYLPGPLTTVNVPDTLSDEWSSRTTSVVRLSLFIIIFHFAFDYSVNSIRNLSY